MANLPNLYRLKASEVDSVLMLLSAMTEFADALNDAKNCQQKENFPDRFTVAMVKHAQLFNQLSAFFNIMAPLEKIGGKLIEDFIKALPPIPNYWDYATEPLRAT